MLLKNLPAIAMLFLSLSVNAQNIPDYVPSAGLVGWWPFSGNAKDSSGKANDGVVTNATLAADRFGKANSAYSFNGSSSKIEIADAASLRVTRITLSVWVYSNITDPRSIIYKGSSTAEGEAFALSSNIGTGVKINSGCVSGAGWKGLAFKKALQPGAWEHLVVTYDGFFLRGYRNGIPDSSAAYEGLIDACTGGGLRFGFNHLRYNASTGDPFNGFIDDIGIWNRALAPEEVQQLFSASLLSVKPANIGINTPNPQRSLHVTDVLRLTPRSFAPPSPDKGDIYFDSTLNKLRVFDGTVWQNCW
jgi:hypothetical protein